MPGRAALLRAVTDALPNVTGIRVEDVLSAIAALLNQVAAALTATGALTLVAGAFVLVGGDRRRTAAAGAGGGDPEDARVLRGGKSERPG